MKQRKNTFEKQNFNENFDHTTPIYKMFSDMGYTNVTVKTDMSNGLSHYVRLSVDVVNEGKLYHEIEPFDGRVYLTIRISNHSSNLERICGGVCGSKMTLSAFKNLIEKQAIKSYN